MGNVLRSGWGLMNAQSQDEAHYSVCPSKWRERTTYEADQESKLRFQRSWQLQLWWNLLTPERLHLSFKNRCLLEVKCLKAINSSNSVGHSKYVCLAISKCFPNGWWQSTVGKKQAGSCRGCGETSFPTHCWGMWTSQDFWRESGSTY